jgi:hypothetical protein
MARRPTQHNMIGPLSNNSLQLPHYTPPPQEWPPSNRVCNANAPKGSTYSQEREWRSSATRPGCQDFLRYPSKGGC